MSGAAIRIRRASAGDLSAIEAIAAQAFSPYIPEIGRRPAPMDADYAAALGDLWLAEALADAADPRAIAGFLQCRASGDALQLLTIAVADAQRGRGVGRALMLQAEALARDAGCTAVALYTNARMTANLSLYPRAGYQEVGRRVQDGFERVFFRKELTGPSVQE